MVTIKAFYQTLDKVKPIDFSDPADQRLYVPNLHGATEVVDDLFNEIDYRDGEGVYFFTGLSGTGKSTELFRLKHKLETDTSSRYKVFYTDLAQWLDPLQPLQLGGFLVAILASWIAQTGSIQGQRSPAQRIGDFLTRTKINITGLDVSLDTGAVSAGLQMGLARDQSVIAQIEDVLRSNKTQFLDQVHALVKELASDLMGSDPAQSQTKIVLLIDSLEKFRGHSGNAEMVYDSILRLFQTPEALKLPLVHVVYSISFLVLEQNAQIPKLFDNTNPVSLPSVHIFENHTQTPDSAGLNRMKDLLTRRFDQWPQFFTPAQIEKIIEKTGGDLRDFLHALKTALITHRDKSTTQVTDAELDRALQGLAPSLTIPSEDITWMAKVDASHQSEIGAGIKAQTLDRYLTTKHILAYRNGGTWYALHPLIRDNIVAMAKHFEQRKRAAEQ